MGYGKEKDKREAKKRRWKIRLLCCAVAAMLALSVFSCILPPESWKYHFSKPEIASRKAGELRIHFLDVGQGDCTLIELPDGKTMLIDGGDDKSQTKTQVMRYLNGLKIKKIDHLVITHTDKDHCGSLEEVFRYKTVVNAYLPHSFEAEDTQYAEVYERALKENCEMIKHSREIDLSNAEASYTLRFLYPYSVEAAGEYSEESAVLYLDYMGTGALFLGDADEEVEEILLRDEALGLLAPNGVQFANTEILKVAHHGSKSATSSALLACLQPKTAVVSCGKDNPYGHPHASVLERLEGVGTEVFRTDEKGHIVVTVKADGSYAVSAIKS